MAHRHHQDHPPSPNTLISNTPCLPAPETHTCVGPIPTANSLGAITSPPTTRKSSSNSDSTATLKVRGALESSNPARPSSSIGGFWSDTPSDLSTATANEIVLRSPSAGEVEERTEDSADDVIARQREWAKPGASAGCWARRLR